ncbi:hypothetical protein ACXR2U_03180 [Jatrophihabitans sp. YIM 134969]
MDRVEDHRLVRAGFTDDQGLFIWRSSNGFLLGSLLSETSAMTLADPKPGDSPTEQLDPLTGNVPEQQYTGWPPASLPGVWPEEFDAGLEELLDRIEQFSGVSRE